MGPGPVGPGMTDYGGILRHLEGLQWGRGLLAPE